MKKFKQIIEENTKNSFYDNAHKILIDNGFKKTQEINKHKIYVKQTTNNLHVIKLSPPTRDDIIHGNNDKNNVIITHSTTNGLKNHYVHDVNIKNSEKKSEKKLHSILKQVK